jgi:hypothetical protein
LNLLLLGLDAAGKTTFLYRYNPSTTHDNIVTTIPSIGFNVETLTAPRTPTGPLSACAWDCGGCDKVRPLWTHLVDEGDALGWFIDVQDSDRLEDSTTEFKLFVGLISKTYEHDGKFPVAIVINKIDLCERRRAAGQRCQSPVAVQAAFLRAIDALTPEQRGRLHVGFFTLAAYTDPKEKLGEFVAWIAACCDAVAKGTALPTAPRLDESTWQEPPANAPESQQQGEGTPPPTVVVAAPPVSASTAAPALPPAMPSQEELLAKFLATTDVPDDPSDLVAEFASGNLSGQFDHRAHIRIAYILLTRDLSAGSSMESAKRSVLEAYRYFFAVADPDRINKFRFHVTMTTFWIAAVASRIPADEYPPFPEFLKQNLELFWPNLWTRHYTRSRLFDEAARNGFVEPDILALPKCIDEAWNTRPK